MGTRGKPDRGGSGGHLPWTKPRAAGTHTSCTRGNSGLRGGYCHGACQLLGFDPWRKECGRKECGVTPGVRMDCGVMPNGRRISLKGAVAHFFLLSFLLPFPFLTQQLVCTHPRIEASRYNPSPLVLVLPRPPSRAALVCVLSSAAAARRLLSLSCLGRRRVPLLSVSCPRPPPCADSCP